MEHSLKMGVSGEYKFTLTRADGTVEDTGWFKNLITDAGLDMLGSLPYMSEMVRYIMLGTDSTPPAVSQTGLIAPITSSKLQNTSTIKGPAPVSPTYACSATWVFSYAVGAVVSNISEVAVGREYFDYAQNKWVYTAFSRSLIKDGAGDPITLTVLATDQLTVSYKLTILPPLTDVTGTVDFNGVSTDYVGRIAYVDKTWISQTTIPPYSLQTISGNDAYSGGTAAKFFGPASILGTITGGPSGDAVVDVRTSPTTAGWAIASADPYVPGSFVGTTHLTVHPTQANFSGGIGTIIVGMSGYYGAQYAGGPSQSNILYQYSFNPPIAKDNTMSLTLSFNTSWGRQV